MTNTKAKKSNHSLARLFAERSWISMACRSNIWNIIKWNSWNRINSLFSKHWLAMFTHQLKTYLEIDNRGKLIRCINSSAHIQQQSNVKIAMHDRVVERWSATMWGENEYFGVFSWASNHPQLSNMVRMILLYTAIRMFLLHGINL